MDKKRVLVVEDNPGLARVLAFSLQQAGFDVTTCPDGAHALAAVQETHYDVVVTDYEMHPMTGEELCRKLRELDQYAAVPIIMVTARETEIDVVKLRADCGLTIVYPKPFSPRQLVRAVLQLVQTEPAGQPVC